MDASKAGVLFQFPALKGLNTQAALPDAPIRLHNAQLTRTGGYAPQRAGRTLKGGVTSALRTGIGNDAWVTAGGIQYLPVTGDEADATLPPIGGPLGHLGVPVNPDGSPLTLDGAALLMPGLALMPDGRYLTKSGVQPPLQALTGVTLETQAADPLPEPPTGQTPPPDPAWKAGRTYVIYAQRVSDGAVQVLPVPVQSQRFEVIAYVHPPGDGEVMLFVEDQTATLPAAHFLGTFGVGTYELSGPAFDGVLEGAATVQVQMDALEFTGVTAAEYHQGRIWLVPGAVRNRGGFAEGQKAALDEALTADGLTLYYSEVTAPGGTPRWRADNYLTVPARCSRRIVALASVGRTLYVLCDREVFAVQGNSDRDLMVESLGDSIGCVASGSVQTLGGAVLYVSESGVLLLQGGQAQEVSGDVRDQVSALGRVLSSTVSHRTETYYLRGREGEVLMFSLRERAWVTRDDPGGPLVRSGGLPLALSAVGLELLDGPDGSPLDMTVVFPHVPAGGWSLRKHFRAVTCGAVGAGVVHAQVSVVDRNAEALDVQSMDAPVTQQRALVFGLRNASGEACSVTLTTTGDLVLLPPVQVVGSMKGEVGAQ